MCFCETILTELFPKRLLTTLDISLQELLKISCFLGASRQEMRSSSYSNFFGRIPSRNAEVYLQQLFWVRTVKKRARLFTPTFLGASRQETRIFSTLAFEVASFKIHAPFIRHLLGALLKIRVSHDCFRRIQKYSC